MALTESSSVTASRGLASHEGRDADRTVVWLRGEHDISTVAGLSETMARAIALDDADLVVDLSGVQFMDASTIGVVIGARNFLRPRSRSLALRSPSRCARRVLDLCGLAGLVDPGPVEGTRITEPADALGTWVAVPATDRCAEASAPKPNRAEEPILVGRVIATRKVSSVDAHDPAEVRTTNVAGRGGP